MRTVGPAQEVGLTWFYRRAWEVVEFKEAPWLLLGRAVSNLFCSSTAQPKIQGWLLHPAGWGRNTDGAGQDHLRPGSCRDTARSRVFLQNESAEWLPVRVDLTQFPSHVDMAMAKGPSQVCCPEAEGPPEVRLQLLSSRVWARDHPHSQTSPDTCRSRLTGSTL